MKNIRGEITVEAAMVLPVIMMVVALMVYISFYVHDNVALKSYAYAAGIENMGEDFTEFEKAVKEKVEKAPVFILRFSVSCSKATGCYCIDIAYDSDVGTGWMDRLMGNISGSYTIKIEKKMSKEILYGFRGVNDQLEQ